jgi:hypothetical protein
MIIEPKIANLEALVTALPADTNQKFQRIYHVSSLTGETRLCPEMIPWVEKQFGSREAVAAQKIVRLTNKITGEESFFNELRTLRPVSLKNAAPLEEEIEKASENDIFREPLVSTTEDIFGRVKGKYCITAGNIAKSDSIHGVLIFNDFNPLHFTREKVIDYIDTAGNGQCRCITQPEANIFSIFGTACGGRGRPWRTGIIK